MKLENIVNSAKKIVAVPLLCGTFLLNPLLTAITQAQEPTKRFFWDLDLRYESALISEIKNVPLKIRDVPIHPGDYGTATGIAPIEDQKVEMYDRISIGTKTGINLYPHNNFRIALGFGLDLDLNAPPLLGRFKYGERKDTVKRNYTNNPGTSKRGADAALTYYQISPTFGPDWNTFLRPSFYSEIEIMLSEKAAIALSCDIFKENIIAENGWDRGNSLEIKDRYNLASLTVGKPCLSVRYYSSPDQYLSFDLGIFDLRTKTLTEMGRDIKIMFNDTALFGGFRAGKRF